MFTKTRKLELINEKVQVCTKCSELVENRTQTVFAKGNPNAEIMLIGESAGQDEDEQGIPFVGRAGKLLDNILDSIGWTLNDVYICNVLKCHPPHNRNPTTEEASNCLPFLELQIQVVNPKYIICLGKIATYYLLDLSESINETRIGKFRKKAFDYENRKVFCVYHPSYLLRNPSAKKEMWEDLQFIIKYIKNQSSFCFFHQSGSCK